MHDGHRDRMRKRFLKEGAEGFEKHELLELLLFYAIPRKNTNEIAHDLLNKFGSLSNLFDAPIEEIIKTPGIGESAAVLLKLVPEIYRNVMKDKLLPKPKIYSVEHAAEFLIAQYLGIQEEAVTLISLDNKNNVKDISIISYGTLNDVIVNIKKVILTLFKYNATQAIIAHNHPQGLPSPSMNDIKMTSELRTVLKSVDVNLVDHIIIAENDYYSLAESKEYRWIFSSKT